MGLLSNLRAGRSTRSVSRVLAHLGGQPHVCHVETDGADAVPDALAELARREVEVLVVHGGDGTLQHALTEILSSPVFPKPPLIAPLRGGRTNMTALDLGAHRDPVKGLDAILRAVREGRLGERVVHRPVLRVDYDAGTATRYGMFFGVGMIHRAIELTHRLFPPGRSQGSLGSMAVTLSLVAKAAMSRPTDGVLAPDKAQIRLDGDHMVPRGEFYLLIATSLRRLFCRINPFWGTEARPVRFTALATDCVKSRHIPISAARVLAGRPPVSLEPEGAFTSRNVDSAEMRLSAGFTIDGEVFPPEPDQVVTLSADERVGFVRG